MIINRPNRILEIIWIVTGLLCLGAGTKLFIINGYSNRILVFGIMSGISFLFAWYRHGERKKS